MSPTGFKCSNDIRDLLVECLVEFINLLTSEANEVCVKENKKTISPEHVLQALKELDFNDFVASVQDVYTEHEKESKDRPRLAKKLDRCGVSQEDLLKAQEALFAKARS